MKSFSLSLDQIDMRLLPLRRSPQVAIGRMADALRKQGQLTPVIVADTVLVDGFKRCAAAQILKHDRLEAMAIDADQVRAKAMTLLLNPGRSRSLIQEALLVKELVEVDGLSQTEVASILDRHKSWVSRRLMFVNSLGPEIIKDIQLELLPPGSGVHLARLHTCNQPDFSAAIQGHRLNVGEVRTLVDLWSKAKDQELRKYLLHDPRQALAVHREQQDVQKVVNRLWKIFASLEKKLVHQDHCRSALELVKNSMQILNTTLEET
ncbi:ParB/RepB/Spo0J family partition protein [Desulfonatronum thioautotrophicum]|uniref:ParB/RepB/Spo0J family partition protein n=1 Tax=Desulfonatronum thioautotrophicum TaxID=617001 RepID=UPI0005EB3D01|nr:ParB N-terminal domain-containing protein [Desulfonatronum thioautotrophicum]